MALLEIENLSKSFGGVLANDGISLQIRQGEIVGLIGPNGAGKTTLFNLIMGVYPPDQGRINFNGGSLIGLRPDEVNKKGIARTFQTLRPFGDMTALENVMVGALCRTSDIGEAREIARQQIEFVGLSHKRDSYADVLSTGERKRLEVARAMATKPKLLLLDEVTAGVDPQGVPLLVGLMRRLNDEGVTLFVIEHRMKVVTTISDRLIAFHLGKRIAEGTPAEITRDELVIESYLGEVYA